MNSRFALNTLYSALFMASTLGAIAPANAADRTWIALDGKQEAGTPVEIAVDLKESDANQTVLDMRIAGFWLEDKKGPDGRLYQKIEIPGLGSHNEIGAPDLPAYRFNLAVPNWGKSAHMQAELGKVATFDNIVPWPEIKPEVDGRSDSKGESQSEEERFVRNDRIYDADGNWPGDVGIKDYGIGSKLRSIPSVTGEAWPVSWNARTQQLEVAGQVRYMIDHRGDDRQFDPITKERYQLADAKFINWEVVGKFIPPNFKFYTSSYLFIYPDASYADEIQPLADQKRTRGFQVSEMTVDDIGNTCNEIRTAISDWADAKPFYHDLYTLLVGDTNEIPLCTAPTGDDTDDLYASTNGDDLDDEVYVGRLSVDDEADLANQIDKILEYEDSPAPFCCYDQAVLWAHKEDAPGKYEGAHETVRTNSYSNPPVFTTLYGSQAGVTDNDVVNEVSDGIGLLAYRGHGSSSSTATSWNQTSEYFNGTDVGNLANAIKQSPVVWSFACTNAALDTSDSIAEKWMEQVGTGSVSYYGATVPSYTSQNHVLDEEMFQAVYEEGLVTQSHAIVWAEDQMASSAGSDNAWMYLLLGDPDMQIRTDNPIQILVRIPELIPVCTFAQCYLELQVSDRYGNPVPEALVGLYKPVEGKEIGGEPEVFVNGYADEKGNIRLPVSPRTEGYLYYAAEDGRGNTVYDAVKVSRR